MSGVMEVLCGWRWPAPFRFSCGVDATPWERQTECRSSAVRTGLFPLSGNVGAIVAEGLSRQAAADDRYGLYLLD